MFKPQFAKVIVRSFRLFKQYYYEYSRFRQYSSAVYYGSNQEKLQALLTMAYHSLEKGLSLEKPSPGFGQKALCVLQCRITEYLAKYGHDNYTQVAINALREYIIFNNDKGVDVKGLENYINNLKLGDGEIAIFFFSDRWDKIYL
jgi:hypothetical protein